ncbi:MAG: CPBP family intramembrane glutamic endopeptidase [candidate division WOR-3 bacterium]
MTTPLALTFAWLCVALTALVTVVGRASCVRRWGDLHGHLAYFGLCFLLLGFVPAVWLWLNDPALLALVGLSIGRIVTGLALLVLSVPLAALLLAGMMRDQSLGEQYPLSREAARIPTGFVLYELVYVLGYYSAWEFAFRGILLFPLAAALGLVPALAIQTALSTLMHIGSPDSEVWGAVAGGVLFGLIAFFTGSILYPFLIHAGLGVAHDVLRRRHLLRTG